MKSGVPTPLRTSPPNKGANDDAALKKLQLLSEWSEMPAQEAAQTVEPRAEVPVVQKSAPAPVNPWDDVTIATDATKMINFRIPIPLYQKLKWLGDTTYGSNMTQIIIEEMTKAANRLLEERGIQPMLPKK